ncbi:hypothetical protein HRbin11_02215 [bacterium HR11]|nr:hypothetical protein HRbin11_02215 [bacterium HR11]
MATYILLSTLTDEGRRTLRERPERIQEVNREVEALGAKVIGQYAVLGPYDFVNIVEAPDNETVARISVELGARGTVQIMSLPAIPVDAFIAGLKKKAPGPASQVEPMPNRRGRRFGRRPGRRSPAVSPRRPGPARRACS